MTRANAEQLKYTPWFAKAGAACSIVPISRFVNDRIFALKGGGYGCLFFLTGIDEEGMTDQELEAQMRSIEGALRGLPEGACLYQYTRVMSGCNLPRKAQYTNPVTQAFVDDRLAFLAKAAGFRRIDLHWCLTLEPPKVAAFARKPQEHAGDTTRMLADLEKTATLLEGHLGSSLGLKLLEKNAVYQFFSYLFNLEEWAARYTLSADDGVDRQIVQSPVAWHSDHLTIGRRYVQMFSLKTTPEASRPCLLLGINVARLRQCSVHDVAPEVRRRRAQRDRRPGEVHLILQSRRSDARDERTGYRIARNRRRGACRQHSG